MRSERRLLRPIDPEEAADLVKGGTAGLDWLDGSPHDGTREAAGMPPSGPEWGIFAIIRSADGLAIGGIGFHGPPADGEAEIGFDLIAGARGQGFATEALRLLSTWALSRVDTVVCTTEVDNVAAQHVITRAGYTRVASPNELLRYELS